MPSDFVPVTSSKSAKRIYTTEQAMLSSWRSGVEAFLADNTISGVISKVPGKKAFTVPIKYFGADLKQRGTITIKVDTEDAYDAVMNALAADQDLSDTIAGVGSDCTEDETEATWKVPVSCVRYDDQYRKDTFTVTFYKKHAVISGYEYDETLAAVEAWFDANTVFQ